MHGASQKYDDLRRRLENLGRATSRQVVYEALCSDLEYLTQLAMSAGTTS